MKNKQRTTIWLSHDIMNELDNMTKKANCRSRSEFIEDAIRFYDGYLKSSQKNTYLPVALASSLQGTVKLSEDRIARLLYKNTVELSMLMNIISATVDIDEDTLKKLRTKCINEVRATNGKIDFESINKFQKS